MKFKSSNKVSSEFNMSSLTDIIFLLLIFFMLTSSSVKGLDIILPSGKGNAVKAQEIIISIDSKGIYYINKKVVPKDMLSTEIELLSAQISSKSIILRAEKDVPLQSVVTVMDIANRYDYKIVLAVKP